MYFKSLKGIIRGKLSNKCVPIKIEHIITYKCNFRCKYCNLWKNKTSELDGSKIKDLITYFSEKGTVSWNFTGGEPLLRQDIEELVDHAKKLGFYVTLNTNGSLIKQNLSWLNRIDLLGISLDAIKAYNKTRDRTFKEIMDNIRLLKSRNINIYICCVLNKNNLKNDCKELKELLGLCKELDIPLSPLPLFEYNSNVINVDEIVPSKEEFKNGINFLIDFKKKNRNLLLVSLSTLKYLSKGFPLPKRTCYAGKYFCTLHPDGKLSGCMFSQQVRNLEDLKKKGKVVCNITGFNCQLCYLEYNNIFSLKPGTLYEFLKRS